MQERALEDFPYANSTSLNVINNAFTRSWCYNEFHNAVYGRNEYCMMPFYW